MPEKASEKASDKYTELTALFRAGQAGDAACYRRFLQQAAGLLRHTVARKLPAADVEDVVQEILISLHTARHTHDGQRPLAPWLFAIARFRLNDHLRRLYATARRETQDENALADAIAVTEAAPDDESLEALLQGIPERERRILTLMHVDGFTARETGQQLGMKESAVKVAAHRAMKKIREKSGTP